MLHLRDGNERLKSPARPGSLLGTLPVGGPAWSSVLRQVPDDAAAAVKQAAPAVEPLAPLPFEGLLQPFVLVARRALFERLRTASTLSPVPGVTDRAYLALERALLVQLVNVSGLTLMQEFDEYCNTGRRAALKLLGGAPGEAPTSGYSAFVREHLDSGWADLFARYAVLERLLGTAVSNWLGASEEFLLRLARDCPEIREDPVVRLFPAQSDPHKGNRAVIIVEQASGRKRVYKPKALELEAAFNHLLGWCNARGLLPPFKPVEVRCCDGYGWSEYVDQLPCGERAAVQRYYRRAGSLLAVLHVVQATDCHRENLIACGEYPILVDAETLLHTFPSPPEQSAALAQATSELREFLGSVIGTGLLPRWDFHAGTQVAVDNSALGCVEVYPSPVSAPRITNPNTDDMMVHYAVSTVSPAKNVPMLAEGPALPEHYLVEICEGFSAAYRLLERERAALLEASGPLAALTGLEARYLLRNTRVYQQWLARSYDPALLRSGTASAERFPELAVQREGLERTLSGELVQWELDALENLDVPYFTRRTDGSAICAGEGRTIEKFFEQSGCQRVQSVIERLSGKELAYQLAIIRNSIFSREEATSQSTEATEPRCLPDATLPTCQEQLEEAVRIGDEILNRAHRRPGGSVTWLGLGYLDSIERFQAQPLGENLYEGKVGVALFLAALAAVTDEPRFARAANEALAVARGLWRDDPEVFEGMVGANSLGVGGIVGLGSIAYGLSVVAKLLNDEELLADAVGTALSLERARIHEDRQYDVMSGAAGALLAILAVQVRSSHPGLLSVAEACGEHLLDSRRKNAEGLWAWARDGRPALTGFSHGAAGIGLALSRLANATGDLRYQEGARTALAFERHHYSPLARNWPDLRGPGKPSEFMTSWCHGAPGIGLSRAAWCAAAGDEQLPLELATAIATTAAHGIRDVDHLCCGNFGRLELLAAAAGPNTDIADGRGSAMARLVAGARTHGGYRLFHNLPRSAWTPGFFRGTAGIGYTLLKGVAPLRLPCVLTLD